MINGFKARASYIAFWECCICLVKTSTSGEKTITNPEWRDIKLFADLPDGWRTKDAGGVVVVLCAECRSAIED